MLRRLLEALLIIAVWAFVLYVLMCAFEGGWK
jgi:hypothetical protein